MNIFYNIYSDSHTYTMKNYNFTILLFIFAKNLMNNIDKQ